MLSELRVRDLGVIAELAVVLEPGLTAVTGETGAGKTLVVEAIELVVGGRADPTVVRAGASEAVVEGRFIGDGDEDLIVGRAIPASGRSRAYLDGGLSTAAALAEATEPLLDLHGQHAHQSLLQPAAQRQALDTYAAIDLGPWETARAEVARLEAEQVELGGDERARAREIDLLRFQCQELDAAGVTAPDEDVALDTEETLLATATESREAAAAAVELVAGDGGVEDSLGRAVALVDGRPALTAAADRLRAIATELADVRSELRDLVETLEDDPERLDAVRSRRQLFRDLRRKYGDTLADVLAFHVEVSHRLTALEEAGVRGETIAAELEAARSRLAAVESEIGTARRAAAPALGEAITAHLQSLALPRAIVSVSVGADPGDEVTFFLAANPGEPALPLAKVASGGELARTMLACRLVLSGGPATMVFDEVDAGIGGEAALAVGRALSELAIDRQVLVVTHLPQVAAFADHHIVVTKSEVDGRTVAEARSVEGTDRVVELSRMLSGQPESSVARVHAEELLASAAAARPGRGAR